MLSFHVFLGQILLFKSHHRGIGNPVVSHSDERPQLTSKIETAPCGELAVNEEMNRKSRVVVAVALTRNVAATPGVL